MKVVKVLNVKESDLDMIEKSLVEVKGKFDLDSPMNAMVNESLTKLLQAKKLNRVDQQKPQENYRYVIETQETL